MLHLSHPLVVSCVLLASGTAFSQAPGCPTDLNNDSLVNGADLALILAYWGSQNVEIDLDGNGVLGVVTSHSSSETGARSAIHSGMKWMFNSSET